MENKNVNKVENTKSEMVMKNLREIRWTMWICTGISLIAIVAITTVLCCQSIYDWSGEIFTTLNEWAAGFMGAFIISAAVAGAVEACFDHNYRCKECGQIHALSYDEEKKIRRGRTHCPECDKVTKHKMVLGKKVISAK